MSGIVQVGGVALASHDSVTDKVSLDSGIVFPAGHILQCKAASKTDKSTTDSTTPASTGLTVVIKPSKAEHKIYVQALVGCLGHSLDKKRTFISISGGTSQSVGDATTGHECGACWWPRSADEAWGQGSLVCAFLDAPDSTSDQSYTLNFWTTSGTCAINSAYNNDANVGNAMSTLTAWEVVA